MRSGLAPRKDGHQAYRTKKLYDPHALLCIRSSEETAGPQERSGGTSGLRMPWISAAATTTLTFVISTGRGEEISMWMLSLGNVF
jgi:hypothetical protein